MIKKRDAPIPEPTGPLPKLPRRGNLYLRKQIKKNTPKSVPAPVPGRSRKPWESL